MTQDLKPGAEAMTWDDVFKSQAIDREGTRLRLFDRDRDVLVKGWKRRGRWWQGFDWWVANQATRRDVASGWALTEWGAIRKAHRRYMKLLNQQLNQQLNRKDEP